MTTLSLRPSRELLKRTTTRCPVCRQVVPGEVWREGVRPAQVFLRRVCPEHGESSACLASDARFYWLAKGSEANACCQTRSAECGTRNEPAGSDDSSLATRPSSLQACCTAEGTATGTLGRNADGHGAGPFETLSTCLALIEIVNSCNLSCPTCYADSPLGAGGKVDAVPLADLQRRIEGVIARKGGLEILQLSGGEPTLHPQFFELLAWAQAHPKIDYVLVNTNGVKLAHDDAFAAQFAEAAARRKLQLYLQFDGVQAAAQHALRGADLRATRERALDRAAAMDLPVTLAMTVTPDNLAHVWEAIAFGLARPTVHGITFQPMFGSGRVSQVQGLKSKVAATERSETLDLGHRTLDSVPATRLNTADILLAAVGQSGGQLQFDDFTPLPCGDPNCATLGYLLRIGGQVHSVSEFLDFAQLQGFLKDKVHYTLEDLARCGCETEPLGALLKTLELKSSVAFRLMVKPFMDAWTWDQDRIDRCCTHVIRPDGKLDSFCRYYSGFADVNGAP